MRPLLHAILVTTLVSGCARKREPAPTELQDLVEFLFMNWEDDELVPEAIDNLGSWLATNVDDEETNRGFQLQPLTDEDVSTVAHPDRDLSGLIGACAGVRSEFPIEAHSTYVPLPDQTFSNPTQYKFYERSLVEGTASGFEGEDTLRTLNTIETSSFGITIPYELKKDYKWVETEQERAIFARSWIEDRSCNKDGEGGNCIEHSYSIDMFYADGSDASLRMTATWSEVDTSITLPEATLVASLALGLNNVFHATEKFLQEAAAE
ncbi:MAG: hypothetical protein KC621_19225 [Myxococcales bacterium]|nr:hypothetical protein [Myxococcales bacterium]